MIPHYNISTQTENTHPNENFAVSKFIRFLKHIGLKDMLAQFPTVGKRIKKFTLTILYYFGPYRFSFFGKSQKMR